MSVFSTGERKIQPYMLAVNKCNYCLERRSPFYFTDPKYTCSIDTSWYHVSEFIIMYSYKTVLIILLIGSLLGPVFTSAAMVFEEVR